MFDKDTVTELLELRRGHELGVARFSGMLGYGTAGIGSLILINGAAALGILSFIGGLIKDKPGHGLDLLSMAGVCFVIGVFCGAVSAITGYITLFIQLPSFTPETRKKWPIWQWTSVSLATASVLFFVAGVLIAIFGVALVRAQ